MRIVFVTTGLGGGGAENALLNLCRELSAALDRVDFAVICLFGGGDGSIAQRLRAMGVRVVGGLEDARSLRRLAALGRELMRLQVMRPHIVQGWMYHGNAFAWILRSLLFPGSRLGGSIHSLWTEPKYLSWKLKVGRCLNLLGAQKGFDHTFFAGHASLEQHVGVGFPRLRSSILPNGIDVPRESGSPRPAARPTIAYVSRLHPDKDNANFVRTLELLERRKFACRVLLLGSGLDDSFVAQQLPGASAFTSVVVEALGFREDVRQQMRSACVLCLSSKSEAFPVSLIEGLAEGLVCVSTDVGDCRHIIGECGATVPRERPDLLADALEQWTRTSHQERERWATRCVRRARDLFSVTQMGRIYTATLFPGLEGKVI